MTIDTKTRFNALDKDQKLRYGTLTHSIRDLARRSKENDEILLEEITSNEKRMEKIVLTEMENNKQVLQTSMENEVSSVRNTIRDVRAQMVVN